MTRRPCGWLFLPLFAMACSVDTGITSRPRDDADDQPVAPQELYAADAFKADYIEAACGWFDRCASVVGNVFGDVAACSAFLDFAFALQSNESGAVTEPLLYRVDSAKANDCLRAVEGRSCASAAPSFDALPDCVAAFVGRLADGECCDRRGGCAPGLVCEMGDPENPQLGYCTAIGDAGETCRTQACAAPATCEDVGGAAPQCVVSLALGVGEACGRTFDCAASLSCQQQPGETSMRCLPRAAVGDVCRLPASPCAAGLYCVGAGAVHLCATTPGSAGQGCEVTSDCAPGLTCLPSDSSELTCVHVGTLAEPCSAAFGERCDDALACIDGQCAAIPAPVAFGDRCVPGGPPCPGSLFDADSACQSNGSGFFCAEPAGVDAPCGGDAQCNFGQGLACDPVTATCRKLPGRGEACPSGLCAPQFTVACVAGTCRDRTPVGSPCTPAADELDEIFATECAFLSGCLPDPVSGATVCTSLLDDEEDGVQCR